MDTYSPVVERHMVELYKSLSEKDRRRYAAGLRPRKLGHGGIQYVARLFGCDEDTVHRGIQDVVQLPEDAALWAASGKSVEAERKQTAQPGLVEAVAARLPIIRRGRPSTESQLGRTARRGDCRASLPPMVGGWLRHRAKPSLTNDLNSTSQAEKTKHQHLRGATNSSSTSVGCGRRSKPRAVPC